MYTDTNSIWMNGWVFKVINLDLLLLGWKLHPVEINQKSTDRGYTSMDLYPEYNRDSHGWYLLLNNGLQRNWGVSMIAWARMHELLQSRCLRIEILLREVVDSGYG